jgi:hypothetical protein
MNNKVIGIIAFAAGAAVGSVATWKLVKTKYEKIAQEEIESIREVYFHNEEDEDEPDPDDEAPKMAEVRSYRDLVDNSGYVNYCGNALREGLCEGLKSPNAEVEAMIKEKAKAIVDECNDILEGSKTEEMKTDKNKPYVIHPDEFGEKDYNIVTLAYYKDGVVTTYNTGEVLSNDEVENLVGIESLSHFGEYEEDTVFVRNDSRKIDYEILRSEDAYTD